MMKIFKYGNIVLADYYEEQSDMYACENATHLRVTLPSSAENVLKMQSMGFCLGDRTLGVSINIARSKINFDKQVRMDIVRTEEYKDEIVRIAKNSFPTDRRFHILPELNTDVAAMVIDEWVNDLDECLVCMYKDTPIGFLSLRQVNDDAMFVHLAAVEEKYRATGAAMSLYAKAASLCKDNGYKKMNGRISTLNTAVMNLYSFLGAGFGLPQDIFLKEV